MDDLTQEFHKEMLNIYKKAKSQCGYNARIFLPMVVDKGGLQTAKDLLHDPSIQYGFTKLWECNCLDLTVEALVLRTPWNELFTADELAVARKRLEDNGYFK